MKDSDDGIDCDQPPMASRASRKIAKRSKHSSRGGVVVQLPSEPHPRVVLFESKLEQRVLFLILARADVWDLREQPPAFLYRGDCGRLRQHTFDFLVELSSGRRIAVAVKPFKVATKRNFVRELRAVRRALTKDYAHDLLLITDRDFTTIEALNAQRLHEFRRGLDCAVAAEVHEAIQKSDFPTTLRALVSDLPNPGCAFRAAFVAIYDNALVADKSTPIDLDTQVHRGKRL